MSENDKLTILELETKRLRISIDKHNRLLWITTGLSIASLAGKFLLEIWR